jgi:hypothetical protein
MSSPRSGTVSRPVLTALAVALLPVLLGLLGLTGCRPGLPEIGSDPEETIPLRTYRDSILDLDLGYPEGWAFTDKSKFIQGGRSVDTYFEPPDPQWTRRFTVKVVLPDRPPLDRTVEAYRAEYLDRLGDRSATVRIIDTSWSTLGGRSAWRARYDVLMDGKAFTRHTDYLTVKDGRDYALVFEVAADRAEPDIVLFDRVAERFRFYRP